MKNYQRLYYQYYYAQNPDGNYVPASRRECFAPGEEPTAANPFRQRWFYDPEAGYAVRLERSQLGESTYRASDTALKREERHRDRKQKTRIVELDKTFLDADGSECCFVLADETADIAAIAEDRELLSSLISALDRLSPDDRELWDFLINKSKKQAIADRFNLTLDGVRYREQRLFKILRTDATLKNFFEKD